MNKQTDLYRWLLRGNVFLGRRFYSQILVSFPSQGLFRLLGQGPCLLWLQGHTVFFSTGSGFHCQSVSFTGSGFPVRVLDFLFRVWLVLCSVGQEKIWLWFQGETVFILLAPFILLTLFSGPESISFTALVLGPKFVSLALDSESECIAFIVCGFRVRLYIFPWLWFQG